MIRRAVLLAVAWGTLGAHAPVDAQEVLYDLLVSSRATNSVKRFDGETGEFVDDFIPSNSAGLTNTQEVLLSPDGDLIVSGLGNPRILRFDYRTGAPKGAFTDGYLLSEPTKMAWGPDGNLYVSQWGSTRETVAVFGPDGAFIEEATPPLEDPMQPAWEDDGSLLVVYWGSNDVLRFPVGGGPSEVFISDSRLEGPVNLRWASDGSLHVFDWQSGAVYRFDGETGEYIDTFIDSLSNPEGWTIGPDGRLYIAEWTAHRVRRFDVDTGQFVDVFASGGGLQEPNSVLFVERPSVFELRTDAADLALTPGESVTFDIEVAGARDVPFDEPVTLECSPRDPVVQCLVDPGSVTPGDGVATATVTVSGVVQGGAGLPAALAWLLALAIGAYGMRRRSWLLMALMVIMVAVACSDATGPEGGSDQTSVRVSGTSDGLRDDVRVVVTVGDGM